MLDTLWAAWPRGTQSRGSLGRGDVDFSVMTLPSSSYFSTSSRGHGKPPVCLASFFCLRCLRHLGGERGVSEHPALFTVRRGWGLLPRPLKSPRDLCVPAQKRRTVSTAGVQARRSLDGAVTTSLALHSLWLRAHCAPPAAAHL